MRWAALAGPLPLLAALVAGAPSYATSTAPANDECDPPPGVTCVLGVPYVDDGNPVHTLDAYYPTDITDRASIVVIHGGFWNQGSSTIFGPEATYLAENGFAVFAINYTLSRPGEPSWPQVDVDVDAATAWVIAHAADFHGDGTRVAVLGGSSGAELAGYVDVAGPEQGVAPLAAVSWSGAMDLKMTYSRGNKAAKHSINEFLGCQPKECPDTYAQASPVTHVSAGDGSMLLFNGQREHIPVAVAREMNQALADAGVPHTLVVLKHSSEHARQYECTMARLDGQRQPVIDDTIRWLGDRLSQPTTPTGTFCLGPSSS